MGQNSKYKDHQRSLINKVISSYCVVVENTFTHLKHWKILAGKFRHYTAASPIQKINFDDVLDVCSGLTNQKLKRSPLCMPGWTSTQAEDHELLAIPNNTKY